MKPLPDQLSFPHPDFAVSGLADIEPKTGTNKLKAQDRKFHNWYRFILSFPPHIVRDYIRDFGLTGQHTLFDPFCGTGTTLVEARCNGIPSIGLEAHPFAAFASSVKLDWAVDPDALSTAAHEIAEVTLKVLRSQGIEEVGFSEADAYKLKKLPPEAEKLLLENSISPLPLHKVLTLLGHLEKHRCEPYYSHELLALANALVSAISNLHFGPEVGVGKPKSDAPVVAAWLMEIEKIAHDLRTVEGLNFPVARVCSGDARAVAQFIEPQSIDAVITSPPYPNEKDYTRTTRLESVLLGFIQNKAQLQALKKGLLRSNTRGVYKADDDDRWVAEHQPIQALAETIEQRRIEMGKTSGFEKLYSRVTRLYFGGMTRHLADLRPLLRPGAQLAYVVGDQASFLRVLIPTGQIVSDIAQSLGYELKRIDLFRTRLATATRQQLREEVVVLKWNG